MATKPPTVSVWPPRYFVVEWTTASAPRSSGCWRYGVAKVLSTTSVAPTACAAAAALRMSTMLSSGFDGVSTEPCHVFVEVRREVVVELARGDVRELVALRLVDLRRHPVDAAVDVGDQHDALAGVDEVHQRRRRADAGAERDAVRAFSRLASATCSAVRVGLRRASSRTPCGRRQPPARTWRSVDRRDDRAGRGIRLLPVVDGARLESVSQARRVQRPASAPDPSAAGPRRTRDPPPGAEDASTPALRSWSGSIRRTTRSPRRIGRT